MISKTSGPKDRGQADHSLVNVYTWVEEHKYDYAHCPTQLLSAPEEQWRARGLDNPHAEELAESFRQTGRPPTHIHAACLVPTRKMAVVLQARKKSKRLQNKLILRLGEKYGWHCPAGNHSRIAWTKNMQQFPLQTKFQTIGFHPLIVPRTPEAMAMLKAFGVLDNRMSSLVLKPSFVDSIAVLRGELELAWKTARQQGMDAKQERKLILKTKQMYRSILGMKVGAFGQYWAIVNWENKKIWNLLEQIINAPKKAFGNLKFVPPKSSTNLLCLGDMPEWAVIDILSNVVHGQHTMGMMKNACIRFKILRRVKESILQNIHGPREFADMQEVLEQSDEDGTQTKSYWMEATSSYPRSTDSTFIETWVEHLLRKGLKAKESLPITFLEQLASLIAMDRKEQDRIARKELVEQDQRQVLQLFFSLQPLSIVQFQCFFMLIPRLLTL